jgi:hypothetical protein
MWLLLPKTQPINGVPEGLNARSPGLDQDPECLVTDAEVCIE